MDKYETGTRHALLHDRPVTSTQASRLAKVSGLPLEELVGQTLFTVHRKLNGILDPELLILRKISGRVVRRNPVSGAIEPVSHAIVSVEDTDSSFLFYSPPQWADWSWFHPFKVRREEIATTATDAYGNFNVYLPRWEIQAISRWRQGRISFGDFSRPRLRDIVQDLEPEYPSESLDAILGKPDLLARCKRKVGRVLTDEIEAILYGQGSARSDERLEILLETPIVPESPHALDELLRGALRTNVAEMGNGLSSEQIQDSASHRSLGPVWHRDLALKLWTLLLDVPDITFRVTRKSDERAEEEVLYSDGFFDVPWSRVSLSDFTLTAAAHTPSKSAISRAWTEYGSLPTTISEPTPLEALRFPRFDNSSAF